MFHFHPPSGFAPGRHYAEAQVRVAEMQVRQRTEIHMQHRQMLEERAVTNKHMIHTNKQMIRERARANDQQQRLWNFMEREQPLGAWQVSV